MPPCLGRTTNHRSITFGYLLHLPVQGCQGRRGPHLCFMESLQFLQDMLKDHETLNKQRSQLKTLMKQEKKDQ
jgi:hypothetical protein